MSDRLTRLLALLLLGILALRADAQPAGAKNPRLAAQLRQAQKLYDTGRYDDAHKAVADLLRAAPAYPGATQLAKRVAQAQERERLALYRRAAWSDAKSAPAGTGVETERPAPLPTPRPAPQPNTTPTDSRRLYEQAESLLDKGAYDAARNVLKEIPPADKDIFDRARMLRARIDAWEKLSERQKLPPSGQKAIMDDVLKKRLNRQVMVARQLFNQGKWNEVIDLCERMRRYAPGDARVRKLLHDASTEVVDRRVRDIEIESDRRLRETLIKTEELMTPPRDWPKLTRPELKPDVRIPGVDEIALEKKLNEKVSIDLIEAPLSYVLDLLARAIGINIIVDPAAVQDKTITINVQHTALGEVLDFITRNEDVSFTKGKNAIYVTTPDKPMLQLRIFHLSKGLTDAQNDITPQAQNQQGGGQQQQQQQQGQQQGGQGGKPSGTSDIERLLEKIELEGLIDWPTGSQYYLDRKRNVLFLRSTPKTLDLVEQMINALDQNPIQVLVTTQFIEIDAENFDDLGVNWNLTNDYPITSEGGADKLVVDAATGTVFDPRVATEAGDTVSSADGLTFGITGILTKAQFQATLRTVKSRFKGRVVNAPQVIAMNNVPARFQETEDLWYIDDYDDRRTDLAGSEDVDSAEPILVPVFVQGPSIGFGLTVTPSVGKDSKDITLLLEPIFRRKSLDSLSSPIIIPGSADEPVNIERPIIVDRRMWAKVTVRDGYHVVLGGMVSATKKEIESKVPLLGDVPLLGWLFKRKTTRNVRKHLLVFVSARILTPEGKMFKTADEEREERLRRMGLLRGTSADPAAGRGLPAGIGVNEARTRETRQVMGPAGAVLDEDLIELKEVGKP